MLDAELARWSRMSYEDLISQLPDVRAYEIELESKRYQVEVQLLENTVDYVHVCVSVDDGSLRQAMFPVTESFITQKSGK